jgi:predicted transcriptional regulator
MLEAAMSAKFNLVLSDELNRQVDEVAGDIETKSAVIRKALAMYIASVKAHREQGLSVGFFDPKTREVRQEIIGL